ncbi:hypothetical protein [Nonomuraea cavernae]|uniref:Uncharacterized protein n=1 Tax=Nonomuraea cavernae TaxID=2045107 RepID=A0A917YW83_9ACTN|nr:hypothetical protein [Nonomuraea cavernae]MCA2186751.1 hypothetical protein [Nonomuraea cavernae]GGO67706.1 hypothetical protein GCM10012289_24760 [Nonomuraea cavernae]
MAQQGDRRGLAFAAIVVVIAAVGLYLTMWPDSGESSGEPVATASTSGAPAVPVNTPLATASDAPFDIYSFLPMSKEQLAAAADLAERFTAAYGTFSYEEDPVAYADRVKVFTTADLGNVLARTLSSPGTVDRNRADEVVSTATARTKEIRSVEKTSVVLVVTGTQQITAKSGSRQLTEDYAVTVSQMGTDWRVFDLQPAGDGQDGDTEG